MKNETRISATAFRADCLNLMETVARTRVAIVITKRGKPVAQLEPISNQPDSLFGYMRGTVTFKDDAIAPAWEP